MTATLSQEAAEATGPLDDCAWLLDPSWMAMEREWAMDDLVSYIRLFSPTYRPAWFHFLIAEFLKDVSDRLKDRGMIVMPPRHGKSTLISRYFPSWHIGRHPDERVMATSYSGRLAQRFGRFSRNLMADPRYPFPGVRLAQDSRSAEVWDVEGRAGGYLSAGVDGSITGEGADVLLIDDPTKSAKEADSETMREGAIEWYRETAYPRLQSGGRIVVVGTRWRDDDLLGYILEQGRLGLGDDFELLHLPAINKEGAALWPEEYPIEELAKRQKNMTTRMWAAQYQGDPQPDDGSMLKRWQWQYWHYPGRPLPPVEVKGPGGTMVKVQPKPLPIFFDHALQSWDMRFGDNKQSGSYVVGQVWKLRHADRYLMHQFRQRVDFTDTILAVKTVTSMFPEVIRKLVEDKANGPAVISSLKGTIPGIVAWDVKNDKVGRAWGAQPLLEAGNCYLPHPMLAPWVDSKNGFVDEAARFPYGENDDQVDAWSQAMAGFLDSSTSRTRSQDTAGVRSGKKLVNASASGLNGRNHWKDEEDEYQ